MNRAFRFGPPKGLGLSDKLNILLMDKILHYPL